MSKKPVTTTDSHDLRVKLRRIVDEMPDLATTLSIERFLHDGRGFAAKVSDAAKVVRDELAEAALTLIIEGGGDSSDASPSSRNDRRTPGLRVVWRDAARSTLEPECRTGEVRGCGTHRPIRGFAWNAGYGK